LSAVVERPQIIEHGPGVVAAEVEGRHVRVSCEKAVLKPPAEVFVIELCFAKAAERRSIGVRTASRNPDRMAARAQFFEQRLAVSLLGIQSVGNVAQANDHENQKPESVRHPRYQREVALP
jgi:hypothetical protein